MHDVLSARSPTVVALAGATDSPAALQGRLWLGVVVLSVLALVVVLASLRRRFCRTDAGGSPPFSLAELRCLKKAGTVSPAEYESLCRSVVERLDRVRGT